MTKEKTGAAVRDCSAMFNGTGEHIAAIQSHKSHGLCQIMVLQIMVLQIMVLPRKEIESFSPRKEVASQRQR